MEIIKLYPQYNCGTDRRQRNVPVEVDRRSGIDRRKTARMAVDPNVQKDYSNLKNIFDPKNQNKDNKPNVEKDAAAGLLSTIPFVRRFTGIESAAASHEYIKAGGKAFLQAINVRGDWNDITKIFKEPSHPNDCQVPFSFTSGTPFEKLDNIQWFKENIDKTVFDVPFVKSFLKKIGMIKVKKIDTGKLDHLGNNIIAKTVEGSLISKILGRACMRIPLLSFAFLSLLEIPSIVKSKNHCQQATKSFINVTSVLSSGAIFGAIGAFAGPLGSLVGLGIGSWLGNKFAQHVNSTISQA